MKKSWGTFVVLLAMGCFASYHVSKVAIDFPINQMTVHPVVAVDDLPGPMIASPSVVAFDDIPDPMTVNSPIVAFDDIPDPMNVQPVVAINDPSDAFGSTHQNA